VAAEAAAALPALRYIVEPSPGLHNGRHRGMREANGEILAYIDDDVEVGPRWIASLACAFRDQSVALVGGNNRPRFDRSPPAWLKRLWEQPSPCGEGRAIPYLSVVELPGEVRDIAPSLVWGCNFCIRKSALAEAGGFHPDAMPDELVRFRGDGEMPVGRHVVASGRRCLFHPGASVEHLVPAARMTPVYFRKRAFLQGISDSYTQLRQRQLSAGATPAPNRPESVPEPLGRLRLATRLTRVGWQLARLGKQVQDGYLEGFRYHRSMFESDAQTRAWVLRRNYLDAAETTRVD
jgi:hypothetical protein